MSSDITDGLMLNLIASPSAILPEVNASTPPTITRAASASPATVTGKTTSLSVLASDSGGASSLTYTWTATAVPAGAAAPTFSANATNAAKATVATFSHAGSYTLLVRATDAAGLSATSTVSVLVSQTLTTIAVSPGTSTVAAGHAQSFTAAAEDQFGAAMATAPAFTWGASAGTITASGVFTAPQSLAPVSVTAAVGTARGSASVTVSDPGPTIATAAAANPSPVTGHTASLSVLGADLAGESSLTYTWTATAVPAGAAAPTFSANATNAAKATVATFSHAGSYTLLARATDAAGLSATSTVSVLVSQTLTTIAVSPGTSTVAPGATKTFTAAAEDQFGAAMATAPRFTWGASAGTITPAGVFMAPQSGGGITITAAAGSVSGSAAVTDPAPYFTSPVSVVSQSDAAGTVVLSAQVADGSGGSLSSYSWSVISRPAGSAWPVMNIDGGPTRLSVSAQAAGTYTYRFTVTDSAGYSASSSVNVTVAQVLTTIAVSPGTSSVINGQTQSFTATADDQFGAPMATPPTFTWGASAGTITSAGLYTAPANATTDTVTASAGSVHGSAAVTVLAGPSIATPAAAGAAAVTGTTVNLSVLGADPAGEAGLTYTWFEVGGPTNLPPTFSANGTNAAKNTTVTFGRAGEYTFLVTATDAHGFSATSSVQVDVEQVFQWMVFSNPYYTVAAGATDQFTPWCFDQFNQFMAPPASCTFSASDGTISPTGLFTAPQQSEIVSVTATVGNDTVSAQVAIDQGGAPIITSLNWNYTPGSVAGTLVVLAVNPDWSRDVTFACSATSSPAGVELPTFGVSTVAGVGLAGGNIAFNGPGSYTIQVTATSPTGAIATQSFSVDVTQVATQVAISPGNADLDINQTVQFSAALLDQFGDSMPYQTVTWSTTLGTITPTGFFTAPDVYQYCIVTATIGSLSEQAVVLVNPYPWLVQPATASSTVVTGTTDQLSALGGDDLGEGVLDYHWGAIQMPQGAPTPTYSDDNSNNSSKQMTVTFYQAGTYVFEADIYLYAGEGLGGPIVFNLTSDVVVTVEQTLTSVVVSPGPVSLAAGQSETLTATGYDQFGQPMTDQPAISWSTTAGAVTSGGVFTEPAGAGPATVTASADSIEGQAEIYPASAAPTVATPAAATPSQVTGTSTILSVLGADAGGASDLVYDWAVTAAPAGAPTPRFSRNDSDAAGTTTVTFGMAGTYGFAVTITDPYGLTTQSTVAVMVVPTATSLRVTPGSIELGPGSSEALAGVETDQFGDAMAVQPSLAWTATAGTVSPAGTLTAPSTCGDVTLTASAGGVQGSTVVDVIQPGFEDTGIRNEVISLAAQGPIDRGAMIALLDFAAGEYPTVDQAEIDDLNLVLAHPALYQIPASVEALASYAVDGNPANATFQGQPLGDLAAGSTTAQMDDLVAKWFLGADHPVMSSGSGLSYVSFPGPLFNGTPSDLDIRQGGVGDCYLLAALGALAKSDPAAIEDMFQDNGDGTWTVRFYNDQGVADYVTVDRYLPAYWGGSELNNGGGIVPLYAGVNGNSINYNNANVLWVALAEKAYAEWNQTGDEALIDNPGGSVGMRDGTNSYAGIDGGVPGTVFQQVLGPSAPMQRGMMNLSEQQLINALAAGDAVVASTGLVAEAGGLVPGHAYIVLGYDSATDQFLLGNPWGIDTSPTAPISFGLLQMYAGDFDIADVGGTVGIDGSGSSMIVSGARGAFLAPALAQASPVSAVPVVWGTLPTDGGPGPIAATRASGAGADHASGHDHASTATVVPASSRGSLADAPSDWWREAFTVRLRGRGVGASIGTPRLSRAVAPAALDALFDT